MLCDQVILRDRPINVAIHRFKNSDLELLQEFIDKSAKIKSLRIGESRLSYVSHLRFNRTLDMRLVPDLLAHPEVLRLVLKDSEVYTHLQVYGLREPGLIESRCQELSRFIAHVPELSELTLDRSVNHEMWCALQSYPRLMELLGNPDEDYAQGVSYGESLRCD